MSLSDINALREHMNTEFAKMSRFIKTTNNTILMMQEAQVLLTDMSKRIQEAMDDFTEQISLQQKQIRALTGLVRQLMPVASLDTPPVRPEQSRQEPSSEQLGRAQSQPSNDEPEMHDLERASRRKNESDDSDR